MAIQQNRFAEGIVAGVGTKATIEAGYPLAIGEIAFATDTNVIYIATSTALGGFMLHGATLPYVAKTANYTATLFDYTIECTANSFTITLPTAVGIAGRIFNIKNTGNGKITIDADGTQTIDNILTQTILNGECITIQSTNANWIIL